MAKKKHTVNNFAVIQNSLAPTLALLETVDRRVREMEAVANSLQGTERLRRSIEAKGTVIDKVLRIASERMAFEATLYERWTRREKQRAKEAAQEIVAILTADKVDRDAAEAWISEHGSTINAGMLAAMIEAAMKQAILNETEKRARARSEHAKSQERAGVVLKFWSRDPEATKADLAHVISGQCEKLAKQAKAKGEADWQRWHWSVSSVRKWLQGKALDDIRQICAME